MPNVLASPVTPILQVDRWEVKEMVLTWEKTEALWHLLSQYKSLFSDLTRGDLGNFINVLTQKNTLFFEIWESTYLPGGPSSEVNVIAEAAEHDKLVGMIWLTGIESSVDAEVHMVFFDRKPREKKPVVIALMKWVFGHYPMHRVTASIPDIYNAQRRFVKDLGLVQEGVKRQAIMSDGKWHDVYVFGLLRQEAEAIQ